MHEDELIFLGAATLASRFGRELTDTEFRTAVTNARKLREEVRASCFVIRRGVRPTWIEFRGGSRF